MKVVVNTCWGGFCLSPAACSILGVGPYDLWEGKDRTNPALVKLLENKGSKFCSGFCSELATVEIPDNVTKFYIEDHDGVEMVVW